MSTTSVAFDHEKLSDQIGAKERNIKKDPRKSVNIRMHASFGFRIFRSILRSLKIMLIALVLSGFYKISGFHAWWTHVVDKFI